MTILLGSILGLIGIAITAFVTYLISKRTNSGTIKYATAGEIFDAAEKIRGEQHQQIIDLKEEVAQLKNEHESLKDEIVTLRAQVRAGRIEADQLRTEAAIAKTEAAMLRKETSKQSEMISVLGTEVGSIKRLVEGTA